MQISPLASYEVAPDGTSVKLNLLDGDVKPASLLVAFALVQVLARNMPTRWSSQCATRRSRRWPSS